MIILCIKLVSVIIFLKMRIVLYILVQFLDGMKTSYGIDLPFSPEITGTAEIITEDYSILQRIFFPIKSLIKNNGPAFFNKTDRLESYFHHTI